MKHLLPIGTNVVTKKFGHGIIIGVFEDSVFPYNVEFECGRQELYCKGGFFFPTEAAYIKSRYNHDDVDFLVE